MSKIGRQSISILQGVEIKLDGNLISVKGAKGALSFIIPSPVGVEISDNKVKVFKKDENKKEINALWGLARAKIANMINGVSAGFTKKLLLEGIGFKAAYQNKKLVLNLGFTNPIEFPVPDGIEIAVDKNIVSISGADKDLVGQIASSIRAFRKPEPYKGTGVKYEGEVIKLKAGKKAATAAK